MTVVRCVAKRSSLENGGLEGWSLLCPITFVHQVYVSPSVKGICFCAVCSDSPNQCSPLIPNQSLQRHHREVAPGQSSHSLLISFLHVSWYVFVAVLWYEAQMSYVAEYSELLGYRWFTVASCVVQLQDNYCGAQLVSSESHCRLLGSNSGDIVNHNRPND